MPGHPFEHPYKRHHFCTTPVFLHISWEFCNDYNFILKDNQNQLDLRRVDDQYIMQAFTNQGYTDKQLRKLNFCRMWAQVITLADLTTGDGKHLISECRDENF
jgi:hypothetical protein